MAKKQYHFNNFDGNHDPYYETIFNESVLIVDGTGNWDIFYHPIKDRCYSIAKVKGCRCTHFGDLNYVKTMIVSGHSVGMVTLQGEKLLNFAEYEINRMMENRAKKAKLFDGFLTK
jgi:hypothetical protein